MNGYSIDYRFTFPDGNKIKFQFFFDRDKFKLINKSIKNPSRWTRTEFHQCPNCTLDPNAIPYCPQAVHLEPIIKAFDESISYDPVRLHVFTNERIVSHNTTVQKGVSSLMGFLIANCGCPVTQFFIPMGRFHLPLASEEETLYRATSTYLLGQYFLKMSGYPADLELDGLIHVYNEIQEVNQAMLKRLRSATRTDSSINALILLDVYAAMTLLSIEERLEEIRHLFYPFLERLKKLNQKIKAPGKNPETSS